MAGVGVVERVRRDYVSEWDEPEAETSDFGGSKLAEAVGAAMDRVVAAPPDESGNRPTPIRRLSAHEAATMEIWPAGEPTF
jgi:hypothetical protein